MNYIKTQSLCSILARVGSCAGCHSKWLPLFLVFMVPAVTEAQFLYLTNNGGIQIISYIGQSRAVTIPAMIDGLPVTSIRSNTLMGGFINSITLPNSITNIGDYAFQFSQLTNVAIPDGVTSIGQEVFSDSSALTNVTIGSGLSSLGAGTFEGCAALVAISVNSNNPSFSSLGGVMFNKDQTTLVKYPAGLGGFYTVPGTVTSIGPEAFYNCFLNTEGRVTFPNGLTSIGDRAFAGCYDLQTVAFPNGLTSIGNFAFSGCPFSSVSIPSTVTNIGEAPFGAPTITVDPANPNYSSVSGVLFNKAQSALIECPTGFAGSYTVPGSVVSIAAQAFFQCSTLTNVTIPNTVTNVGSEAFAFCFRLTGIAVNSSNPAYSSVGGVLFDKSQTTIIQYPGGLAGNYTIPGTVTQIGDYAFYFATVLTGLTIPNSVKSIGNFAFQQSQSLTNVVIGNNVNSIGEGAFLGCSALRNIIIPNSVVSIGDFAFLNPGNGSSLVSVSIGSGVATIGELAFSGCPLTNVNIPNSVRDIGESAFGGCNNLTNVTIGSGVSNLGRGAFGSCPELSSVLIPNSVASIGEVAFGYCNSLTNVNIGSGASSIGVGAFFGCTILSNVIIPKNVASIGDEAFAGCVLLTNVDFYGNAPSADATVFSGDNGTVFYLPGATGWAATFGGLPTALWALPFPVILSGGPTFGVHSNQFGFTVSWATNTSIVVEASTNLVNPSWIPVQTNTLVNGTLNFSDPQWRNFSGRYYRVRNP